MSPRGIELRLQFAPSGEFKAEVISQLLYRHVVGSELNGTMPFVGREPDLIAANIDEICVCTLHVLIGYRLISILEYIRISDVIGNAIVRLLDLIQLILLDQFGKSNDLFCVIFNYNEPTDFRDCFPFVVAGYAYAVAFLGCSCVSPSKLIRSPCQRPEPLWGLLQMKQLFLGWHFSHRIDAILAGRPRATFATTTDLLTIGCYPSIKQLLLRGSHFELPLPIFR